MTLWLLFYEESERYEYDSRDLTAIYASREEAINRFNAELDQSNQKDQYGNMFSRWKQEIELTALQILKYSRNSKGLVSQAWIIEAWEFEGEIPDGEKPVKKLCKGTVAYPNKHRSLYADDLSITIDGKLIKERLDSLIEVCFTAFPDVNPREIAGLVIGLAMNQAEKQTVLWRRVQENNEE